MPNAEVAAEIARLESEIGRIQRELEALKRSVGLAPSNKRTQAFSNPVVAAADEAAETERPRPSIPLNSETVPTSSNRPKSDRRVQQSARTGLTEFPPAQNPTPSRRAANVDPGAGRYEYVGEGRSKPRR